MFVVAEFTSQIISIQIDKTRITYEKLVYLKSVERFFAVFLISISSQIKFKFTLIIICNCIRRPLFFHPSSQTSENVVFEYNYVYNRIHTASIRKTQVTTTERHVHEQKVNLFNPFSLSHLGPMKYSWIHLCVCTMIRNDRRDRSQECERERRAYWIQFDLFACILLGTLLRNHMFGFLISLGARALLHCILKILFSNNNNNDIM